ncbi:MAG: hypothetical protein ACOZDD_04245 [Bacteroidota bacterium]
MKKISLIIASLIFSVGMVVAQTSDTNVASHSVSVTVPEVALIDVEGGELVTFVLAAPTEAGEGFEAPASDNNLWLNMTSIVEQGKTRNITVQMNNALSTALSLKVTATGDAGNGNGSFGTAGNTLIGTAASDLITGIGSGYTGNGANNGYNLTYELVINESNYADLYAITQTVEVTYTLTDEN